MINFAKFASSQDSTSIFKCMSEQDWIDLTARGQQVNFSRGSELLEQGQTGDRLLILIEGNARVSLLTANGHEIVLAYAEPGAVLGEIAVLDGGERTASVFATTEGSAFQLSRNALRSFLRDHPDFAWSIMEQIARRLRIANQTIESDRAYASGPRLARFLRRLIKHNLKGNIRLELNQTELGNFAGMSREHINRQLKSWEGSGIVSLEYGKVRILDFALLEDISESEE